MPPVIAPSWTKRQIAILSVGVQIACGGIVVVGRDLINRLFEFFDAELANVDI